MTPVLETVVGPRLGVVGPTGGVASGVRVGVEAPGCAYSGLCSTYALMKRRCSSGVGYPEGLNP